jgi:hypothetical protein
MDQAALDALYPSATPAAPPTATPAPVAPKPQAAAAAPAEVEETAEQRIERVFASPEKKAADAAAAAAKPAEGDAAPASFDAAHPDTGLAEPVAREIGLTHGQATKLHALHQQMSAAAIARQSDTWASEAAKLPPADIADAQRAVKQFGTPQLKELLNRTGLGNNAEVIKAFARALRSNPYRGF